MKLRMHGNSLRLRLNRAEVSQLAETGRVEEVVQFAPNVAFRYALETATDADAPRALYDNGGVRVLVPAAAAREWASTERVAIAGEQTTLNILVEKDFRCLHGESEPDADAFPNPASAR